jgi:NAD-dependent dihydropyrimidine dehydrogenase PreA subunit
MFMVTVNEELCVGCAQCVLSCPGQILKMENEKAAVSDDECLGCQSCVSVCPAGAIQVDEY